MLLNQALQKKCTCTSAGCPIACQIRALSSTLDCSDSPLEAMALNSMCQVCSYIAV